MWRDPPSHRWCVPSDIVHGTARYVRRHRRPRGAGTSAEHSGTGAEQGRNRGGTGKGGAVMWFVGIDWGDTTIMKSQPSTNREAREEPCAWRTPQKVCRDWYAGSWTLSAQAPVAADGTSTPNPEHIACIVETSSGLLVTALLDAGFAVYPINPRTLGQRRNPAGAKTDQIDALLLAPLGTQ